MLVWAIKPLPISKAKKHVAELPSENIALLHENQRRKALCGRGSKPWYLVNIKIAGKWMFIPLKMVCIGIDS
jgi:hypothetical protein